MQTQRAELLSQLSENGWRIASIEQNLEWWADEMWLIESTWSPVGSNAYVTFLVDPQFDGVRIDRLNTEDEFTLSLGQGWQKRLPEIIEHLSAIRHRRNSSARS